MATHLMSLAIVAAFALLWVLIDGGHGFPRYSLLVFLVAEIALSRLRGIKTYRFNRPPSTIS